MRILVADDERDLAEALEAMLKREHFSVDVVYDGQDALDYGLAENYDCLVLDIMMPRRDGLEVLRQLREKGVATPVLLLTAKGEVTDRIKGLNAGADDYLSKPFAMGEFVARVRALTRRSGAFTPDQLTVGDSVYAIGNPLGVELRGTLTDGIVSAINRDVWVDGRTMTLIQTNAALNSGNSGGPLINAYGQVVGINTIKMSSSYSNIEGLGFAIPSASIRRLVNDLLTYGEVQPEPTFGVTVNQLGTWLEEDLRGIQVIDVTAGSAADLAGIRTGDFILSAAGTPVNSSQDLLRVRRGLYVGDQVTMEIWRDGQRLEVTLELNDAAS